MYRAYDPNLSATARATDTDFAINYVKGQVVGKVWRDIITFAEAPSLSAYTRTSPPPPLVGSIVVQFWL